MRGERGKSERATHSLPLSILLGTQGAPVAPPGTAAAGGGRRPAIARIFDSEVGRRPVASDIDDPQSAWSKHRWNSQTQSTML